MKKLIVTSVIIILLCLTGFYFFDKNCIVCPIKYKGEIVIRADSRGNGLFGCGRNGNRLHEGIDLFADVGTPVLAARTGIVVAATQNRGMGKYIVIRHLNGLKTIYGHLSQIYVKNRTFAWRGQIIGAVGKTGNARYKMIGSHLHFEIRKDGIPQDPLTYLK